MFSTIYTVVFPAIDRFFTFLGLIAGMPFNDVVNYVTVGGSEDVITAIGFTGQIFEFQPPQLGALSVVVEWFSKGVGAAFGVSDMPFFLALLLIFAYSFIFILTLKFLLSVISGIAG